MYHPLHQYYRLLSRDRKEKHARDYIHKQNRRVKRRVLPLSKQNSARCANWERERKTHRRNPTSETSNQEEKTNSRSSGHLPESSFEFAMICMSDWIRLVLDSGTMKNSLFLSWYTHPRVCLMMRL